MNASNLFRLPATLVAGLMLAAAALAPMPAAAKNSISLSGGVKCSWVLVSSVKGVNTYTQVCRRGH